MSFVRGKLRSVILIIVSTVVATAFVAAAASASTTIGSDISTGGNLTVTGTTTVDGIIAAGGGVAQPGGGDGSNVLIWLDEDPSIFPYAFNAHFEGQPSTDFGYGYQDNSDIFHLGSTDGTNYPEIQIDAPNNTFSFNAPASFTGGPVSTSLNNTGAPATITPTGNFISGINNGTNIASVDMGGYSLFGNSVLMSENGNVTNELTTAAYEASLVGELGANRIAGFNVWGSVGGATLTAPFNIGGIINGSSHWDLSNSVNYAGFNQDGMVITSGHTLSGYWRGFSAVPPTLNNGANISGEVSGLYLDSFANGPGATNYAIHSAGGTSRLETGAANVVGLDIVSNSGQTANLQRWLANDGSTVLADVNKDGGAYFAGNVGISTTSPVANFQVANGSSATTTMEVGSSGQDKGSCLKLYRTDGSAIYAYVAAGATTFTLTTTACANVTNF